MRCADRIGVLKCRGQNAKGGDLKLKLRDEFAVELCKTDNLCNVPDNFWLRPVYKKMMFRHGRTISVRTNVNPNKFKTFGKERL